jgi:hypothetical protein
MKLRLPEVTLAMIDVQCHELARLAVEDSTREIQFGDVVIFSDERIDVADARWVKVPKWPSTDEYCRYFWYELPNHLSTRWMLQIQWDGWVIDPSCWTDEFLDYDYVGAPWWYNDGLNVGNGCALRSLRLMRFLAAHPDCFPLNMRQEDHLLCRIYRLTLERCGFRWAPEKLASRFSLECTRPSENSRHFMFHDSFNFPAVLAGERLAERVRLMRQNPSLARKVAELDRGRRAQILPRLAAG